MLLFQGSALPDQIVSPMSEASVSPTSNVETIPCKVNWKDRKATDVGCGVLFLVSLLAWFGKLVTWEGSEPSIFWGLVRVFCVYDYVGGYN